jgi:hypothetical protein
MNSKTTTALTMGILWLLGSTAAVSADPNHLSLKAANIQRDTGKGGKNLLTLTIEADKAIPMDGKSGAFGYASLSDKGNNVLVVVTHLPIDDSTHEQLPSGFHAHVLDLKAPGAECAGANFEVDVENSKKNTAFDADYRWEVQGSTLKVKDVPAADLGDGGIEGIASFTLKPILDQNGAPTHLCVTVVDQI